MSIAILIGWGLVLILISISFWIRRRLRVRAAFSTRSGSLVQLPKRAAMQNAGERLVYINEDGSARELTAEERKYVDTEFSPFDGARPYIKSHYSQRTALGEIRGYLPRTEVPDGTPINPAPPESAQPQTPQAVADSISQLIRKHSPA